MKKNQHKKQTHGGALLKNEDNIRCVCLNNKIMEWKHSLLTTKIAIAL